MKTNKQKLITDWIQLIGDVKIEELRAAAISEKKKKRLWINRYCDDEQVAELYIRIFTYNEPTKKLAKLARDVWGIKPNWKLQQFERGLERWIDRIKTTLLEAKRAAETPTELRKVAVAEDKLKTLYAKIDALGVLGGAIQIQAERLMFIHEKEKNMERVAPFKLTDTIQRTLTHQVETYMQLAMKTGALDSVPDEVNINLKMRADTVHDAFVNRDGKRMADIADKFLQRIEQEALSCRFDRETGTYKVVCGVEGMPALLESEQEEE